MTISAIASRHTFKKLAKPATVGQLRSKTVATLVPPTGDDDPLWRERFREYWELQEKVYGLRMSDFTYVYDDDIQMVTSFSTVLEVLSGTRH